MNEAYYWCLQYLLRNVPHLIATQEELESILMLIGRDRDMIHEECGARPTMVIATVMFVHNYVALRVARGDK